MALRGKKRSLWLPWAFFFKMPNAGLHSKRVCSPWDIRILFISNLQSPLPLLNWTVVIRVLLVMYQSLNISVLNLLFDELSSLNSWSFSYMTFIFQVANQQCLSYVKCKQLRCNLMPGPRHGYGRRWVTSPSSIMVLSHFSCSEQWDSWGTNVVFYWSCLDLPFPGIWSNKDFGTGLIGQGRLVMCMSIIIVAFLWTFYNLSASSLNSRQ